MSQKLWSSWRSKLHPGQRIDAELSDAQIMAAMLANPYRVRRSKLEKQRRETARDMRERDKAETKARIEAAYQKRHRWDL